jgi:hypothetical protein
MLLLLRKDLVHFDMVYAHVNKNPPYYLYYKKISTDVLVR